MRKVVTVDAGPLIAFARLQQLGLLAQVFDCVMVTDEVFSECTCRPDFAETATLQDAARSQLLQRCVTPASHFELALHIDAGEASTIAAAVALGCGVLMDDKAGRRMANNFGLASIGTVGALVLAKQKKLIPAVKPLLEQLTQTGYFLGDNLIANALLAVAEN